MSPGPIGSVGLITCGMAAEFLCPELGGENSCCHFPITRCPKETGHLPVCLDARGLVDSLRHLASSRSRSKRQNLTRCQVSCAKSLRTIFASELLRFDRYGWSCEKYQRIPIEIVYLNLSHKLFVSNSYSCFSLTAPCSFCQGLALHTLPKHSTAVPWS